MIYLVGNWKSNKNLDQSVQWFKDLGSFDPAGQIHVVIAPAFPFIAQAHQVITSLSLPIDLSTQDISAYPYGAYTGAIASDMVKDYVAYAIVGHSERRRLFGESSQDIANKVTQALESGITPIVCVDQPYLSEQMSALDSEDMDKIIVAYEPVSAIGSGTPDTPAHADSMGQQIKQLAGDIDLPVLYGGSVDPSDVVSYVSVPNIDGVLVGGASLDQAVWHDLLNRVLTME